MANEVLALDMDDVTVRHAEDFILWSNTVWGTNLTLDDYTEAWHELWGISLEEVEVRKRLFFTDEIISKFKIVEGAAEGITALSGIRRIIGVTARREHLRGVTEQALELIAPGAVDRVIFATHFKGGRKITRSKVDICAEIGAREMIDDQLKHCLAVSRIGVRAVLFGDYAWNRCEEGLPDGIVRARNWPEVLRHFGIYDRATNTDE